MPQGKSVSSTRGRQDQDRERELASGEAMESGPDRDAGEPNERDREDVGQSRDFGSRESGRASERDRGNAARSGNSEEEEMDFQEEGEERQVGQEGGGHPGEREQGGMDVNQIAQAGQMSLQTVANMHSRMLRDGLRFHAELLDFARRRIGADIETQDRLVRCQTVNDAMGVMNEFYQSAMRDYSNGAAELVSLCVGMATEGSESTMRLTESQPQSMQRGGDEMQQEGAREGSRRTRKESERGARRHPRGSGEGARA